MYPYFEIFGKQIGLYGLCAVLGLLVCGAVAFYLGKKKNIIFEDILLAMIAVGVGLLVGGHLLYGITNIEKIIKILALPDLSFFTQKIPAIAMFFGGSVFYGGFLGGTLGIYLFAKKVLPQRRGELLDMYAVFIPLFHVFGRIGCFLGGCCYGIECEFGFIVTGNELSPLINGVRRFPVQLVEAAANLLIFLLLFYLFRRGTKRRLIYYYMLVYPVCRFTLEFFRGDAIRGIWFGLSTSQWISIILFIFSVSRLIYLKHKEKTV